MVRSILLLTIFFQLFIYADDVKFKNGNQLRNVQIIDSTETYYTVKTSSQIITLTKSSIMAIDIKPLTEPFVSLMITADGVERLDPIGGVNLVAKNPEKIFPNLSLIPAAITFGVLAFDYFDGASNISDTKYKSKYTVYGIISGLAAITTLIYSLKSVTVSTNGSSLSVSYNF